MSSIRVPAIVPPPLADCVELQRAFQGLGCDGAAVISILAHRSLEQRLQIKEAYVNLYREDLLQRIKSELHFNFEKAMLLWMLDCSARDAHILKDLVRSRTPFSSRRKKRALVEMLCLQSAEDLRYLSQTYSSTFQRSLCEDVVASTEGFGRKLFAQVLAANPDTDVGKAETDSECARALHEATEGRADCINDATFLQMLTTKSKPELLSILNEYKEVHGRDVYKAIKKGAVEDAHTTIREIVKFISNPQRFFAKTLYRSMKGLGTDDETLIRVVVTRAEVDMQQIKSEFIRKYKVSLDKTIWSDTSGNYRLFLMALIGGNCSHRDSFLSRRL